MNAENFYRLKEKNPSWANKNIVTVDLCDVEMPEKEVQIRNKGLIPSHVMAIRDSMVREGQKVPVTFEKIVLDCGSIRYRPADGNHRCWAAIEEGMESIDGIVRKFKNTVERTLYQVLQNNHSEAKASETDDFVDAICLLNDDAANCPDEVNGATFGTVVPASTWEKTAIRWVKSNFEVGDTRARSIVDRYMRGLKSVKVKSWMKSQVTEAFKEKTSLGWVGDKVGEESNGWVYYTVHKTSHIFPNVTGNGFKKKTGNGNYEIAVVVSIDGMSGKEGKDLDAARRSIIDNINTANGSHLLKKGKKLVDKIFLMPQKLDASHEEHEGALYEVKKGAKGKFSLQVPKVGWDEEGNAN